jgi:hypothetical protein
MIQSETTTAPVPSARMPGPERLWRSVLAVAIVGGPLGVAVGGTLAPAIHGSGAQTIAANAAADAARNGGHLVAFFVASFLLPLGAFGLALLAYRRTPWLATIGGLLGVVGWIPYAALTALDDLARVMAQQPDGAAYGPVLDRFTVDPTMNTYLLIYVVCHLVAYVLFGIALRRARVLPLWAACAMVASSPATILAFALPGRVGGSGGTVALVTGLVALLLLAVGSAPAAWAMAVRRLSADR